MTDHAIPVFDYEVRMYLRYLVADVHCRKYKEKTPLLGKKQLDYNREFTVAWYIPEQCSLPLQRRGPLFLKLRLGDPRLGLCHKSKWGSLLFACLRVERKHFGNILETP